MDPDVRIILRGSFVRRWYEIHLDQTGFNTLKSVIKIKALYYFQEIHVRSQSERPMNMTI